MKGDLSVSFGIRKSNGFLVAPVPVQKNHITPQLMTTDSVVPGGESRPFGPSASATPQCLFLRLTVTVVLRSTPYLLTVCGHYLSQTSPPVSYLKPDDFILTLRLVPVWSKDSTARMSGVL